MDVDLLVGYTVDGDAVNVKYKSVGSFWRQRYIVSVDIEENWS